MITGQRGATFLELLLAMALMTILFCVGYAISNSFIGVKKVREHELAMGLAYQALEAARAARFREIGASKDGRKDTLLYDFSAKDNMYDGERGEGFVPLVKIGNIEFKREVQVLDAPSLIDGMTAGLKVIRVLVQWKAPDDGTPLTFEAVSTIAE